MNCDQPMKPLPQPTGGKPINQHEGPNRKERRKQAAELRRAKKICKKVKQALGE